MPIEKTYLPPEARTEVNPETGKEETKIVHPWEIKWTKDEKNDPEGKERHELDDVFKDSAPAMMHEGWKEWNSIGETTITKPDGTTDVVRADKEHLYRSQPGFCVTATRPTFTINVPWEGSMKRDGIRRQIIKRDYTETWYHDGRHVLEERNGHNAQF